MGGIGRVGVGRDEGDEEVLGDGDGDGVGRYCLFRGRRDRLCRLLLSYLFQSLVDANSRGSSRGDGVADGVHHGAGRKVSEVICAGVMVGLYSLGAWC